MTRKRLLPFSLFVLAFALLAVFPVLLTQEKNGLSAATPLAFTLAGTHPEAALQSTATGKTLARLQAFNGKIYAGYGDYTANTGPIALDPYNPSTGSFTGKLYSSPTEAILNFRTINNKLYAPDIDPIAGESSGGYAIGEPWSHKAPVAAIHMFDVGTLTGSDLWMVGASGSNATAWRSTDGGVTWSVAQTDAPIKAGDYARYYWLASLNGKLYLQARMLNSGEVKPAKIFDGTSWTTGTSQTMAFGDSRTPVVFQNKIVLPTAGLSTYTGSGDPAQVTSFRVASGYQITKDFYVDGSYLYVLCYNQEILRSSDLNNWEDLGKAPTGSVSIAVLNNQIYTGAGDAQLYRSNTIGTTLPPADTTAPSVSLTAPANGSTVKGSVTLAASASDNVGVTSVSFLIDGKTVGSDSTSPYGLTWNSATVGDGNHVLTAQASDAAGNSRTSGSVTVTVKNAVTATKTGVGGTTSTPTATTSNPASDTTAPVITASGGNSSVQQVAGKPAVSGSVALQAPTEITTADGTVTKTVKAEYYLDGKLVKTITTAPFVTDLDTKSLPDGNHKLTIRVYDQSGSFKETSQTLLVSNKRKIAVLPIAVMSGAVVALLTGSGLLWHAALARRAAAAVFQATPSAAASMAPTVPAAAPQSAGVGQVISPILPEQPASSTAPPENTQPR